MYWVGFRLLGVVGSGCRPNTIVCFNLGMLCSTFSGGVWFEECCDAAVVVVTLSDLFDAATFERAMT